MADIQETTDAKPLDETSDYKPKFDSDGLVAAVAIERDSGKPLMLAFMNQQAIDKSLESGFAHFWSRSRQTLWQKGETSGNRLKISQILIDCDQDSLCLMVEVEGKGAACHTGRHSCYYRTLEREASADQKITLVHTDDEPRFDPNTVYGRKA